jgi:hypothetical protein
MPASAPSAPSAPATPATPATPAASVTSLAEHSGGSGSLSVTPPVRHAFPSLSVVGESLAYFGSKVVTNSITEGFGALASFAAHLAVLNSPYYNSLPAMGVLSYTLNVVTQAIVEKAITSCVPKLPKLKFDNKTQAALLMLNSVLGAGGMLLGSYLVVSRLDLEKYTDPNNALVNLLGNNWNVLAVVTSVGIGNYAHNMGMAGAEAIANMLVPADADRLEYDVSGAARLIYRLAAVFPTEFLPWLFIFESGSNLPEYARGSLPGSIGGAAALALRPYVEKKVLHGVVADCLPDTQSENIELNQV